MATVVASHKRAEDVVRVEEAVAVAAAVDADEDEVAVEDAIATAHSSMAWTCQTTPANSLTMR